MLTAKYHRCRLVTMVYTAQQHGINCTFKENMKFLQIVTIEKYSFHFDLNTKQKKLPVKKASNLRSQLNFHIRMADSTKRHHMNVPLQKCPSFYGVVHLCLCVSLHCWESGPGLVHLLLAGYWVVALHIICKIQGWICSYKLK